MEASAELPACSESVWTSCKGESVLQAPVQDGSSPTGAGSTEREASGRSVSRPTTTHCSWKDVCFSEGFDRGLLASMEENSALESSRPRRSAFRVLLDICASVGFGLVWLFDTVFLGVCTVELCTARYGGLPPFAAVVTLAATANAVVSAAAFGFIFPLASFNRVLLFALCFAFFGSCGAAAAAADAAARAAAAARRLQDEALQPLAPSTVWPPNLHVESISPSAPVPPAFVCPITMAPMANPAITPRGTSYDREALCDWITKQHRYPGGEARAAPAQTSVRLFGRSH